MAGLFRDGIASLASCPVNRGERDFGWTIWISGGINTIQRERCNTGWIVPEINFYSRGWGINSSPTLQILQWSVECFENGGTYVTQGAHLRKIRGELIPSTKWYKFLLFPYMWPTSVEKSWSSNQDSFKWILAASQKEVCHFEDKVWHICTRHFFLFLHFIFRIQRLFYSSIGWHSIILWLLKVHCLWNQMWNKKPGW